MLTGRVSRDQRQCPLERGDRQYAYLGPGVQRGQHARVRGLRSGFLARAPEPDAQLRLAVGAAAALLSLNDSYRPRRWRTSGGVGGRATCSSPERSPGKALAIQHLTSQDEPAYKTDWNNFAPSFGLRGGRSAAEGARSVRFSAATADTVDPRRVFAGVQPRRDGRFHRVYGGNPGGTVSTANRKGLSTWPTPRRAARCSSARPAGSGPAPSRRRRSIQLRARHRRSTLRTEPAGALRPVVDRGLSARDQPEDRLEVRYVGTRSCRASPTTTSTRSTSLKTDSSMSSGRRRPTCRPTSRRAAATRSPNRPGLARRRCRSTSAPTGSAGQAGDAQLYGEPLHEHTSSRLLAMYNPNPAAMTAATATPPVSLDEYDAAAAMRHSAERRRGWIPVNFFVANPDLLGGAFISGNGGGTRYDSMQVELRRRLSNGLLVQGNYVLASDRVSSRYSFRAPRASRTARRRPATRSRSTGSTSCRSAGAGASGATSADWLERLIGGWEFDGSGRIQSGVVLSFGNDRLVGMTHKELQDVYKTALSDDGRQAALHPAAGHHRQHDQGVQRQRDLGDRLRHLRPADRPVLRAGQWSGLHPGRPRRLRAAQSLRHRAEDRQLRPDAVKRITLFARDRTSSCAASFLNAFNNINFVGGGPDGQQRDDQSGYRRGPRREQHAESGRTSRAVRLSRDLVSMGSRARECAHDSQSRIVPNQ